MHIHSYHTYLEMHAYTYPPLHTYIHTNTYIHAFMRAYVHKNIHLERCIDYIGGFTAKNVIFIKPLARSISYSGSFTAQSNVWNKSNRYKWFVFQFI